MVVDKRGPRWGVALGVICLACGYLPLYSAYTKGAGQSSFTLLCLASLLTGIGSCSAFSGSIKVCATNWPHHRGTATALPLSAFGLSAFAYTSIGGLAFPHDAGHLLLFIAIGAITTVSTGMLFLRLLPPGPVYKGIPQDERPGVHRKDSNHMSRSSSRQAKFQRSTVIEDEQSMYISATQKAHFSNNLSLQTPSRTNRPRRHRFYRIPATWMTPTKPSPTKILAYIGQISPARHCCGVGLSGSFSSCSGCCAGWV